MRARLAALACCLVTTAIAAGPVPFTDLLDLYLEGQYDQAVAQGATADLTHLSAIFEKDVPAWIDRGDQPGRRGAAAAAFLLELMDARMATDFQRFVGPLEAMCARLRAEPSRTTFELAWYHASLALIGRARNEGPLSWSPSSPEPEPPHLDHALARFPNEPAFELARIVARTWTGDEEPDRNGDAATRRRGLRAGSPLGPDDYPAVMLADVLAQLDRLASDPRVGGEAILRSGQVYLALGRPADALQAFERARQRVTTPQVRYLSFFLAGRALTALQRPEEARRAYAGALTVLPHAESAAVALAALQFAAGDPAAANATIVRGSPWSPAVADPGRLVNYGTYMYWREWRAALRTELRK